MAATPGPPLPADAQSPPARYLVGVVHQRAVITVVTHAVPVSVPLVGVVDVGAVVSLVEDTCGVQGEQSRQSSEKARCFAYSIKQLTAKRLFNKKEI